MSEPPASERSGRAAWLLAFALGLAASAGGSWIATRGRALFWFDWTVFALYALLLSAPFALLALIGVRAWQAWALAAGLTCLFWGGFFRLGSGIGP